MDKKTLSLLVMQSGKKFAYMTGYHYGEMYGNNKVYEVSTSHFNCRGNWEESSCKAIIMRIRRREIFVKLNEVEK